jgi:hypothetical protein
MYLKDVVRYEIVGGALHKSRTDYDCVSSNLYLGTDDYYAAMQTYLTCTHDLRYEFAREVEGGCCGLRGMRDSGYYVELQAINADDECYLISRADYVYDDYMRDLEEAE